jgi:MFS family permease
MLRILFSVFLVLYAAKIGVAQNMAIFAQASLGLTTSMASFLATCYGIFQFFGQLLVGPLSRALSQRMLIVLYAFCCLVACAVPAVPGMPAPGLFVAEAFLGLTNGVQTVATVLAMRMAPDSAGEAAGVITTAVALAVAAGPLLFSSVFTAFRRTGYDGGVFLIVAVIVLSDLALCSRLPTDVHIAKCRAHAAHESMQKSTKGSVSTVAVSEA